MSSAMEARSAASMTCGSKGGRLRCAGLPRTDGPAGSAIRCKAAAALLEGLPDARSGRRPRWRLHGHLPLERVGGCQLLGRSAIPVVDLGQATREFRRSPVPTPISTLLRFRPVDRAEHDEIRRLVAVDQHVVRRAAAEFCSSAAARPTPLPVSAAWPANASPQGTPCGSVPGPWHHRGRGHTSIPASPAAPGTR